MPEAGSPLQEITNPDFSLWALFMNADPIVKAVMVLLLLFSLWSWAVAVDKYFAISGANGKAKRFENAFWSGQSMDELSSRVGDKTSDAMARVFASGVREWKEAKRLKDLSDVASSSLVDRARGQMKVAVNRESARLEAGLASLAIIASSAPFIGLFGTVVGIMNAFRDIATKGETNLSVVAPGIAEALFATAMGLAAAIPALIFYNMLSGSVGRFSERMDNFAEEFAIRLSRRVAERKDD